MKNLIVLLGLYTIIIGGCGQPNKKVNLESELKSIWYNKGDHYTVKSFYPNGVLFRELKLTMDSVFYGATIEYYANGSIENWYWFSRLAMREVATVCYDSTGHFVMFSGKPFIGIDVYNNELYAEVINPPDDKRNYFVVRYIDSLNGKEVKVIYRLPEVTDSTAWVYLPEHKYKKKHKYTLWYLAIDSLKKKILDSTSIVIHNDADTIIYAPDY